MQKVLMKRIFRELKDNLFRYLALFFMIILGMYMIVSLVGSAENIINGVSEGMVRNNVEDGEFTVFVPIEQQEIKKLADKEVTIEEQFYLDYLLEDNSTIRIYKNRNDINKVELKTGKLAKKTGEIVLTKHYAQNHNLMVGNSIEIGNRKFEITGIGSTPDYDVELKNLSDTVAEGNKFGIGFVIKEDYDTLRNEKNFSRTEEYVYTYIIKSEVTDEELKDYLCDLPFDRNKVKDTYFLDYLNELEEDKIKLQNGINELMDGSSNLLDGTNKLVDGVNDLKEGTKEFHDATKQLEEGTEKFQNGTGELQGGVNELVDATGRLKDGTGQFLEGTVQLAKGTQAVNDGAGQLKGGLIEYANGVSKVDDGVATLTDGLNQVSFSTQEVGTLAETVKDGSSSLNDGITYLASVKDTMLMFINSISEDNMPEADKEKIRSYMEGISDTAVGSNQVLQGTTALEGATKQLSQSIKALADGSVALKDGTGQLKSNISKLTSGIDNLSKGTATLSGGVSTLSQKASELHKGVVKTDDGMRELQSGASELAEASVEISHGAKTINEKSIDLKTGANELSDGVNSLNDGANDLYGGIVELKEKTDEIINTYFTADIDNLIQFMKREDNPRIGGSIDDVLINKLAGMVAGIIVMVLFTYVISVFVIHGIEKETTVIGALYALGATKKQLMRHYLCLPVFITCIGGIIGTILGFSSFGVTKQMQASMDYFLLPNIPNIYPAYLVIYGIIMPPVVAIAVNSIAINKKLSKTALSLMKNEQKQSSKSQLNFHKLKFGTAFKIRQFFREFRSSMAIVVGMLISLLILMLGCNCYVICNYMNTQNKEDTKFQYMYTYKYPTKEIPDKGTACYMENLTKESFGYQLEVTILGVENNNPYFNVEVKSGKNKLIISDSVATKFKLSIGDDLILKDDVNNTNYAFTVEKIVPYSVGLYTFMDINSMRELFNQEKDYYNVVFSKESLNVDSGRIFATTTKDDISKASEVFLNNMQPMIKSMIGVSAIIFTIVMYLMVKVMIDRSSFSISLLKIFGYKNKEIRNLYLNGNFLLVIITAVFCIPIAKYVMDLIYPYFVSNVACGMNLKFTWQMYAIIYMGIIVCYFIINKVLERKLRKMVPADVLKERE